MFDPRILLFRSYVRLKCAHRAISTSASGPSIYRCVGLRVTRRFESSFSKRRNKLKIHVSANPSCFAFRLPHLASRISPLAFRLSSFRDPANSNGSSFYLHRANIFFFIAKRSSRFVERGRVFRENKTSSTLPQTGRS